nr:4-hydroxythreonine-4-phosphate dehydrogenase PdxA [Blochmannia endosymbiont of Camponotus (Colobopsis) obliquus]
MITGSMHTVIINDTDIPFKGRTEFLAKNSGNKKVIMMFLNKKLRIAIAMTHIPILEVPKKLLNNSLTTPYLF